MCHLLSPRLFGFPGGLRAQPNVRRVCVCVSSFEHVGSYKTAVHKLDVQSLKQRHTGLQSNQRFLGWYDDSQIRKQPAMQAARMSVWRRSIKHTLPVWCFSSFPLKESNYPYDNRKATSLSDWNSIVSLCIVIIRHRLSFSFKHSWARRWWGSRVQRTQAAKLARQIGCPVGILQHWDIYIFSVFLPPPLLCVVIVDAAATLLCSPHRRLGCLSAALAGSQQNGGFSLCWLPLIWHSRSLKLHTVAPPDRPEDMRMCVGKYPTCIKGVNVGEALFFSWGRHS